MAEYRITRPVRAHAIHRILPNERAAFHMCEAMLRYGVDPFSVVFEPRSGVRGVWHVFGKVDVEEAGAVRLFAEVDAEWYRNYAPTKSKPQA
jgi:hypothetical protein